MLRLKSAPLLDLPWFDGRSTPLTLTRSLTLTLPLTRTLSLTLTLTLTLTRFQHALEPCAASVAPKVRHRLLRALRSFARLSDEVPDGIRVRVGLGIRVRVLGLGLEPYPYPYP